MLRTAHPIIDVEGSCRIDAGIDRGDHSRRSPITRTARVNRITSNIYESRTL